MNVYIDTNIFIDHYSNRAPFFESANKIITLCKSRKLTGCLGAHTFTDIFYILRKEYSEDERRKLLTEMCDLFYVITLDEPKIKSALKNTAFRDFEDCLQAECAAACRADYIVTRNVEDFAGSRVKAITPEELIKLAEEGNK